MKQSKQTLNKVPITRKIDTGLHALVVGAVFQQVQMFR